MESRGVPTLMVHTKAFRTLAHTTLDYRHYGHVAHFELPQDFESVSEVGVQEMADEYASEIVRSLLGYASTWSSRPGIAGGGTEPWV